MDQSVEARRDNSDAKELLQRLKTEVYHDSNEELALGLGRPVEEIEAWFAGSENIDEDAEMKIHGLVEERLGGE